IGGGWMGLHAARRLAELRPDRKVILADAGGSATMHQADAWDSLSIWLTIRASRILSKTSRAIAKSFRQILKAPNIFGRLLRSSGLSATGIRKESITVRQPSTASRIWSSFPKLSIA